MILLGGGTVIDGAGAAARRADVLVNGGRIAAIEPSVAPGETGRIDCSGLVVAPGFIDAHSHSDLKALEGRMEKVRQGVTTEIVGNCGFSAFPCGPHPAALREFANGILCGGDGWAWHSAAEYLRAARAAPAANVFSLVGHGSLRVACAGMRQGALGSGEAAAMEADLSDALVAGCIGFSTGLMYAPGSGAPFAELARLCTITARHGGIYCTHMRGYSGDLLESLEEQLRLAEAGGCRLQISHLQAVGRANWENQDAALERIERARRSGIDVEFDSYPYLAGSTLLQQLLPQEALDGGVALLLAQLGDSAFRSDLAARMELRAWEDILIAGVGSRRNQSLVGLSIAEIARRRGGEPAETVLGLLAEERADVKILSFNQSEPNLRALLTHPLCTVVSDGFYVNGRPHPRLFGTFPEFLGRYCREKQWLTLEEAVYKITGKPAARFGLKDRGVLRPGAFADIAVFDPLRVSSPASYDCPEQPPRGIALVLREGRVVFRSEEFA